jgi:hypothetical protein
MKKILILLLLITATIYADNSKNDSAFSKKIIGKWQQSVKQGQISLNAILIYKKDGSLDSTATMTINKKQNKMTISGTWEVKEGYLITIIKSKSKNVPLPIGHISKDQILKLTDSTFTYKTAQGKTETQVKVK